MGNIRFSIIVTFYNQHEFVKDALDSALSQRNAGLEVIAVDDGSTDGSQDILKQYGDAVRLVCLDANQGVSKARNFGAALAVGDYLAFLDGDDAFAPGAFDVYERLVQAKKPKMILGSMIWFKGSLPAGHSNCAQQQIRIVEYKDYFEKDRGFGNSASALVVDRGSFQTAHGWASDIFPMEDQDLTMRLGDAGLTVQILSPSTIFHRAHDHNSINQIPPFIASLYDMIRGERLGRYPGGDARHHERSGLLGGLVVHWTKRAVKAGLYWDAMKLMTRGSPIAMVAASRRVGVLLKGRRHGETIEA